MLALKSEKNERESEMLLGFSMEESEFVDGGDLLDTIDFDDLFAGISDGDVLPDLEMDQEILAEFSSSESETNSVKSESAAPDSVSVSDVALESPDKTEGRPEPESKPTVKNRASQETERSGKNPAGKKKAKVDWTAELHRRFVTAVEQLGIDKAVPSRILEIMGIDCLTRHNIASHLQKYRSHRKHLQAREAEAASWSRRRQLYGTAATPTEVNPWIAPAPTMGFPPATPPLPHFRPPLHVWGHPSVDQSLMYTWPKHVALPPHAWPPPPLADPSFWHSHHRHVSLVPPPGALCFPPTRFPPAAAAADVAAAKTLPQTPSDVHPSKESIDAAIGDVIRKPWLPLPLGLKPPSMDGVMVELQRQARRVQDSSYLLIRSIPLSQPMQ